MFRVVKASQPATSQQFIYETSEAIQEDLNHVKELLHELCQSTGGELQKQYSNTYDRVEFLAHKIDDIYDEFYGVEASTEVKAADEDLPKGYYDEYYGQTAYEEYGELVAEKLSGKIISKRADDGEKPGGLIYEAEKLGIDDFFDLLKCLEGMCYNGKAVEISDYQYKVK